MVASKNYLDFSETSNWNWAEGFVNQKIGKLLIEIDTFSKLAKFGSIDIDNAMTLNEETKNYIRVDSLKRFAYNLQMLSGNSAFAMRSKVRDDFFEIKEKIDKICSYVDLNINGCIYSYTRDEVKGNSKININELMFNKILSELSILHNKILDPLNKSELIFGHTEEVDPREMLEKIKKDWIEAR